MTLARFLDAQRLVHAGALAEIRAGRKRSHWMWFVFPQLQGLGHSEMSRRYALDDLAEARAYLAHPVLGPRLYEITAATLPHAAAGARALFGKPDDLKFHASMTLFACATNTGAANTGAANTGIAAPFDAALAAFFDGQPHSATLDLLGQTPAPGPGADSQ